MDSDQILSFQTWFKIHTNVSNCERASLKSKQTLTFFLSNPVMSLLFNEKCARALTKGCVWTGALARARCACTKNVHKQLGKGINYREIGCKFGVSASTASEKINTAGTDENLFRLVPVPGHGAPIRAALH